MGCPVEGWGRFFVLYDRASNNVLSEFDTRDEAEAYRDRLLVLNPGTEEELQVFEFGDAA